jgi:hypothetical protein
VLGLQGLCLVQGLEIGQGFRLSFQTKVMTRLMSKVRVEFRVMFWARVWFRGMVCVRVRSRSLLGLGLSLITKTC